MLKSHAEKYVIKGAENGAGFYFSDAVLHPIADKAHRLVSAGTLQGRGLNDADFVICNLEIELEDSKSMIIEALANFDPALGQKAAEVLGNPGRLEDNPYYPLKHVEAGTAWAMQNRPAGATEDWMKNPLPYSVIDFDYDGTINSTVYLAHELGHAIADDYQREFHRKDDSYRENPAHMVETQAYFVQNIVSEYLKKHPNPDIARAAQTQFSADMGRNLYDMSLSLAAMDVLEAAHTGLVIDPDHIFESRFGANWPQIIERFRYSDGYQPAKEVYAAATALQVSKDQETQQNALATLSGSFQRLQGNSRSAGITIASGLALHLKDQNLATRRATSEMLLGRQGAKSIQEVLARAGIERSEDMDRLAENAAENIATLNAVPRLSQTLPPSSAISQTTRDLG